MLRLTSTKSAFSRMNYAAALSKGCPTSDEKAHNNYSSVSPGDSSQIPARSRSTSPSQRPKVTDDDEQVYVLTILTDKAHHDRMTGLRRQYFPKHLNKLAAHLTLFHALPGSKLERHILPVLADVASNTSPFRVVARDPFRLKKGFAVSIAQGDGGARGKQVHLDLQHHWQAEGFLSDQDSGGCRLHYTIQNKVDDEAEIQRQYGQFQQQWQPDTGYAEGLALWRYDRGFWRWERKFTFRGPADVHTKS